jgi:hypothetical protein
MPLRAGEPQLGVLWGQQPVAHDVRCAAAVSRPPSVWTGGSDGVLVRWLLHEGGDATPVACMLGHAGAVVALASASGGPDDEHDKAVRLCQRKHVVPGASRVLRR